MTDDEFSLPIIKDCEKCAIFLYLLKKMECPTKEDFCQAIGVTSASSFFRILNTIRASFLVDVSFVQLRDGRRGRGGYYKVNDWGIINPDLLESHDAYFRKMIQKRQSSK